MQQSQIYYGQRRFDSARFRLQICVPGPGEAQSDYAAFVAKTVAYITGELRGTFPGVPVYVALGNNDSGCGDYRFDGGSDFLATLARSVVAGLPKSADQKKVLADFTTGGNYSVLMAAPMWNTRLIVLDDISMAPRYTTCSGKQDAVGRAAQTAWLQKELAEARRHKQRVWVMGHIPPGVDIYSTFAKMRNVCANEKPEMFLASDKLGDILIENADLVRLGIFAHTHTEEEELRRLGRKAMSRGRGGDQDDFVNLSCECEQSFLHCGAGRSCRGEVGGLQCLLRFERDRARYFMVEGVRLREDLSPDGFLAGGVEEAD